MFELPIANTTAELIAEWIWGEALAGLRRERITTAGRLTVGVEEAPGQAGWYSAEVAVEAAEGSSAGAANGEATESIGLKEEHDGRDL